MDARLAELYGTNTPDEADLEKLAAAEFADGLSEDEEIDLDDVDEETLEQLAKEIVDDEGQEKVAGEDDEEEEPDEDQEKVAEADQLGRIMAHAYVQELRGIDKVAAKFRKHNEFAGAARGGSSPSTGSATGAIRGENKVKSHLRLGHKLEHAGRKGEAAVKRGAKWAGGKVSAGAKALAGTKAGQFAGKHGGKAARFAGKHRTKGALGLAASLGAEETWRRKHGSATPALDELATQRANEILAESGYVPEPEQGGEEPTQYDVLAQAVEQRAHAMLEDAGYTRDE